MTHGTSLARKPAAGHADDDVELIDAKAVAKIEEHIDEAMLARLRQTIETLEAIVNDRRLLAAISAMVLPARSCASSPRATSAT